MVGLIACGGKKRAEATPASDLYVGSFFKLCRRVIEHECDEWAILSAKHGVVLPDRVIEPYDMKLAAMPAGYRRQWARIANGQLRQRWPDGRFFVLAGADYRQALSGLDAWCPWDDLPVTQRGIGYQQQWLTRRLKAA